MLLDIREGWDFIGSVRKHPRFTGSVTANHRKPVNQPVSESYLYTLRRVFFPMLTYISNRKVQCLYATCFGGYLTAARLLYDKNFGDPTEEEFGSNMMVTARNGFVVYEEWSQRVSIMWCGFKGHTELHQSQYPKFSRSRQEPNDILMFCFLLQ